MGSPGWARLTSITHRMAIGLIGGPEYPPITPLRAGRRVSGPPGFCYDNSPARSARSIPSTTLFSCEKR